MCIAVIGTTRISAPAPARVVSEFERNTLNKSADWEATLSPVFEVPAVLTTFAESEAKNRDLLSKIFKILSLTAPTELNGLAAEGLEVVSVALAEEKERAWVCLVATEKQNSRTEITRNPFLKLKEYNKSIMIYYVHYY